MADPTALTPKSSPDATANWGAGQSTSTAGATYTSLTAQECAAVTVSNHSTADVELVNGTSGNGFVLPAGAQITIVVTADASEIGWRRDDQAATSTTISYIWTA